MRLLTRTVSRNRVARSVVVGTAVAIMTFSPADAQGGGRLDLVAQTLFVTEDPAEIVLRVSGAPDGARLEVTVFQTPLLTREAVRDAHNGTPSIGRKLSLFECSLDGPCAQADIAFGTGGLVTLTLLEEEIGEALRKFPGALPLVVRLLDQDRNELDSLTTSLLVRIDEDAHNLDVAFVGRLGAPLARQSSQTLQLDVDALLNSAATLQARAELPIAIEVRPETLETLRQVDPVALETVLAIIASRPLLRTPWVEVDEEAWRAANHSAEVVAQYSLGSTTLENIVGTSPTGLVRIDDDANTETLGLLRTIGASAVIVTDDQINASTQRLSPFRPFQLLDENGVAITALRIDADLHETLDDDDSVLAGYHALAELAVAALASPQDLGVLLDVDELDPVALDVLLEGLSITGKLRVADVTDLLDLDPARTAGGGIARGLLITSRVADVTELATEIAATRASIDTLEAMVEPDLDPISGLRIQLLAAVSTDLTTNEALDYLDVVNTAVLAGTTGFSIVPSDRITLTDRLTDLPFTIVNNQPLPINVAILLSGEKLNFPGGERLLRRLQPGENELVIPVKTLASGDARVTITLTSPDGFLELGSGSVDIRSTAISGLGLIISIVALVILGAWWIRTIRDVRRSRAAATVSAASGVDGEDR